MIVDAHQHYWQLDRGDYAWLTPSMALLYRDFLPDDLSPLLAASGIGSTVLVQAAATEAETHYLFDMARHTPSVAGVVGWVDMAAIDAPDRISSLKAASGGLLKGIRPMIQDIPEDDWVISRAVDAGFAALESMGLAFDALVYPRHLANLRTRVERNPGLRTVIDHCGKPDIAQGEFDAWTRGMRDMARHTNASCKLSGLLTQLAEGQPVDAVRPYAEFVLEEFGARRVMWGSDWPVLGLRSGYEDWFRLARSLLAVMPAEDVEAVLGGNAIRFYGL